MDEVTLITASLGEERSRKERSRKGLARTSASTDSSRSYSGHATNRCVTAPRAGEGSPGLRARASRCDDPARVPSESERRPEATRPPGGVRRWPFLPPPSATSRSSTAAAAASCAAEVA